MIFFMIAQRIKRNHIEKGPYYRYFVAGLFVKIFGGIAVWLVYVYYYNGGDTLAYYHDNTVLVRLFLIHPSSAIKFSLFEVNDQIWSEFVSHNEWPYFFF